MTIIYKDQKRYVSLLKTERIEIEHLYEKALNFLNAFPFSKHRT